jgi:zinc ribbon family protein
MKHIGINEFKEKLISLGRLDMANFDQEKEKLLEQYDTFAEKFKDLYLAGKDRGKEAMGHAMEKAHAELLALGEFSAEQGESMKMYLARDLEQTITDAKGLGNAISNEAKDKLQPSRLRAGALSSLAYVLKHSSSALLALNNKTIDAITYSTGEITSAGSLTCQGCGYKMHLKKTGHIPPCSKCSGTLFHKGY